VTLVFIVAIIVFVAAVFLGAVVILVAAVFLGAVVIFVAAVGVRLTFFQTILALFQAVVAFFKQVVARTSGVPAHLIDFGKLRTALVVLAFAILRVLAAHGLATLAVVQFLFALVQALLDVVTPVVVVVIGVRFGACWRLRRWFMGRACWRLRRWFVGGRAVAASAVAHGAATFDTLEAVRLMVAFVVGLEENLT
jgi:hypothetical protein